MSRALEKLQAALANEAKRASKSVKEALETLGRIHAERLTGGIYRSDNQDQARQKLASALSRLKASSDLSARLALRFPSVKAPLGPESFAARPEDIIPDFVIPVVFEEAVRDLEERDIYGADALKRAGLEVEDVYGGVTDPRTGALYFRHGFAAAQAADLEVAAKVKERLVAGLAEGKPTAEVVEELQEDWSWPQSYAATVVRTNYATAQTAGRFREATRLQDSGIAFGFRFDAVSDADVRRGRPQDHGENHLALDGLVARVDDPIWRRFSPPGGFGCRCTISPVVGEDVPEKFVQVPAGAAFAPGFGSRPDIQGYA